MKLEEFDGRGGGQGGRLGGGGRIGGGGGEGGRGGELSGGSGGSGGIRAEKEGRDWRNCATSTGLCQRSMMERLVGFKGHWKICCVVCRVILHSGNRADSLLERRRL